MTGFTRVPVLALCVLCFVARISTSTVSQKKVSFEGARSVTIAYRLDGNGFKYATEREISTVKVWLQEVQYQVTYICKHDNSIICIIKKHFFFQIFQNF
uniref:Putative secreted protein n=1 Tax=Ixodes ricinus TaxID=34613 RepID=A0A6B0UFH7_IXORI